MMITINDNSSLKLDPRNSSRLKEYSLKSLNTLLQEKSDFFLCSQSLDNNDFYNSSLWTIRDDTLYTNNIMGFIGIPGCPVKITSRFTHDANKDYFLHYMLQKVFLGQIVNLEIDTNQDAVWDFLYYLFPFLLNKALSQGVYKEYINKKHNNLNVRGVIDVKRNIQKNIPFIGNIAYNTREHSYNNKITQLIRHTIEYIQKKTVGKNILYSQKQTRESIEQIIYATPDFHNGTRRATIRDSIERISNPYWNDYDLLRKLCLKILNEDKIGFANNTYDKIHGIIFDGAWLWEEYLSTILPSSFIHPDNRKREKRIYLAENNTLPRFPDFYSKDKTIVLDAKYKHIGEDRREDIHQIMAYMYALQSEKGILVYPSESEQTKEFTLEGYGNNLIHKNFLIPKETETFEDFCEKMQQNEQDFLKSLFIT